MHRQQQGAVMTAAHMSSPEQPQTVAEDHRVMSYKKLYDHGTLEQKQVITIQEA